MSKAKMLKDTFHEAKEKKENEDSKRRDNVYYSIPELRALLEMAKANVYPDGSFGDDDCNAWSLFTEAIRYGKGMDA